MPADPWTFHNRFLEYQGDNTIDMDNDVFVMALFTSASNANNPTVGDATTLTNELSGNGYARQTLTTGWNRTAGVVNFASSTAVFTASGGPLVARFAVVIDTSTVPDEVVASTLLENAPTPSDITINDGQQGRIALPNGIGDLERTP